MASVEFIKAKRMLSKEQKIIVASRRYIQKNKA